jgi:transcriptional regulator with XRE-family HTH domain
VFEGGERSVVDNLAAVVGDRLRRLRTQAGKSVREQARELGISASSLSSLENAHGGISLQRLQQVADHFDLHVTDLLSERDAPARPAEPLEVLRGDALPPGVERGTGTLYQLLGSGGRGHDLQPYLVSLQPGGGYEQDVLAHAGEEFAYVLFGEVELIYGDERVRLRMGDSARFATEVPHGFRNGSSQAVAVVVGAATPPW